MLIFVSLDRTVDLWEFAFFVGSMRVFIVRIIRVLFVGDVFEVQSGKVLGRLDWVFRRG